jgi:hypothetical protein
VGQIRRRKYQKNTKATINYRHKFFASLQIDDLMEVNYHDGKAASLWNRIKRRIGQYENQQSSSVFDSFVRII